jgi:hypothetical protein
MPQQWNTNSRRRAKVTQLVLARDGGICHLCRQSGATTVDHLVPQSAGGPQWSLDNLAAAHKSCNSARGATPLEQWRHVNPTEPRPLQAATEREVVLVCGPPGAGKTTRARALATARDLTLYDRDDPHWTGERAFTAALARLGLDPAARAVVIRSCATQTAWQTTAHLIGATRTDLVTTDPRTCKDRIAHDTRAYRTGTWASRDKRLAGVDQWWRAYNGAPWTPDRPALTPSRAW